MPSYTSISAEKLARLVGTANAPVIIDVRLADDFIADPRLLPATLRHSHADAPVWSAAYAGQSVVVICQRGKKLSEGAAAWLRHFGADAEVAEGGFEAWREAGLPLVPAAALPARN